MRSFSLDSGHIATGATASKCSLIRDKSVFISNVTVFVITTAYVFVQYNHTIFSGKPTYLFFGKLIMAKVKSLLVICGTIKENKD